MNILQKIKIKGPEVLIRGPYQRLWTALHWRAFAAYGVGTVVKPGNFTYDTIRLGNFVFIDYGCRFWAHHSQIVIKDKVGIAAECVIMAWDHNTSCVGKYIYDFGEDDNVPENHRDVIIDEDVWMGTRCVVLKGTHIKRGAVIGAGSVVRGVIPPYAVVAGNPARVYRFRADVATLVAHEAKLYPANERLDPALLEHYRQRVESQWRNGKDPI